MCEDIDIRDLEVQAQEIRERLNAYTSEKVSDENEIQVCRNSEKILQNEMNTYQKYSDNAKAKGDLRLKAASDRIVLKLKNDLEQVRQRLAAAHRNHNLLREQMEDERYQLKLLQHRIDAIRQGQAMPVA